MSDEQDKNESGAADAAGRSASGESANSSSDSSVSKSAAAGAMRPSGKRKAEANESEASSAAVQVVKPKVRRGSSEQDHVSRNPFVHILTFLREVVAEMRKVIWPTKNEMVTYTIVVLIFIVGIVGLTTGLDVGFGKAVTVIFG
ncbi:preprotein translocase subunit SecE [Tomitella biformata]|uniref:preprotein translocase subunit SecE n=1 Tax=Tomitella biformata TaxID=630403 RepID=UPI000467B0E5|nr:preprotein translocase subunit SecE [Tomitella biformata]